MPQNGIETLALAHFIGFTKAGADEKSVDEFAGNHGLPHRGPPTARTVVWVYAGGRALAAMWCKIKRIPCSLNLFSKDFTSR